MTDQGAAVGAKALESGSGLPDRRPVPSPRRALIVPPEPDEATPAEPPDTIATTTTEVPRVRMRQRIARLGTGRAQTPALDPLFRIVRANHPKADLHLLERAYRVADSQHHGQTRQSGDAYITHPLAVTTILAELGMTEPTLCAALLHDTVEDTDYTLRQVTKEFGTEIARLVDGCTKLDKVTYGDSAKSETIRKMIIAMSKDVRVLVIKLADRLHNMRTLHYLRADKQSRIASETLEIFAPLAHRLGMNAIKWELEDLAFSTLHPKVYDEIVRMVAEAAPSRDEFLSGVIDQVQGDLRSAKIKASVTGRPKHYYSIYQKMVVRGRDFSDIFDLVGLRVLVESNRDCYAALGVLHVRWNPLPGRFKDYIAMPKFNMYQSLHTTVLGPEGKPVELQIRTDEMHRRAEYGVAAHWKYKEGKGTPLLAKGGDDAGDLVWVRQLLDWQRETADPGEFLDSLRFEINSSEVYVFTPKGEVVSLPQGSTPIDFAYTIHTEVGHTTHRRPGQRPAGAARVGAGQRRRGGDLHVQGAERGTQPRLADVCQEPPGPEQDQALFHPRAARGVDRERQGGAGQAVAQGRPAAAAAADPRAPDRGRRLLQAGRRHRPVRGGRRGHCRRAVRGQPADHRRGRRRDGRRRDQRGPGHHRAAQAAPPAADAPSRASG